MPTDLPTGALVVSEYAGNALAFVDPETLDVLARVATGQNPAYLAVGERKVFASCSGDGTVAVLDLQAASAPKQVQVGRQPLALCFDDAAGKLYVVDYYASRISTVDPLLASVVGSVEVGRVGYHNRTDPPDCCRIDAGVGRRPTTAAVAEQGMVYVANYGTYDVALIDMASGAETATFDGVVGPRKIALSADGSALLLAGVGGEEEEKESELVVLDRATGSRLARVPVGLAVSGVCVAPDGARVYAIAKDDGVLVALDAASWTELGRCTLEPGLDSLALSADGSRAYVGASSIGALFSVDTDSMEVVGEARGFASNKDIVVIPW